MANLLGKSSESMYIGERPFWPGFPTWGRQSSQFALNLTAITLNKRRRNGTSQNDGTLYQPKLILLALRSQIDFDVILLL